MKKLASKEFIIGICVIVALVVLFFGIDFLKGINLFKPANFYIAEYSNVAGLEVAAPVNIDGYKVGQVREINFDYENPGKIEVVLALDRKLRIPEDTKAIIGSSLLGGSFIDLQVGHSKNFIDVGGHIATDAKPDLMASVSNELLPSVAAVIPKVDTLLYNLNILTGNPALSTSISRLDGISSNLLATTSSLNGTMTSVQSNVPAIMGSARRITYNIDTITAGLGALSYQLKTLPLQTTMGNVEQVTANLQKFSEQLNNPNSTLGMLMNDPELYNRLNQISADVDSLIVDLQRNPKRYISIKLL